jgi:hypothetical protein
MHYCHLKRKASLEGPLSFCREALDERIHRAATERALTLIQNDRIEAGINVHFEQHHIEAYHKLLYYRDELTRL